MLSKLLARLHQLQLSFFLCGYNIFFLMSVFHAILHKLYVSYLLSPHHPVSFATQTWIYSLSLHLFLCEIIGICSVNCSIIKLLYLLSLNSGFILKRHFLHAKQITTKHNFFKAKNSSLNP